MNGSVGVMRHKFHSDFDVCYLGETVWMKSGMNNLVCLSLKIMKYEQSAKHMNNILGEVINNFATSKT